MEVSASALYQIDYQKFSAPRLSGEKDDRLYRTAQEFEAIFVKQMLQSMRKTVQKNDLLDGGFAEELYQDMLYDEYALLMAKTANFGLADLIYERYEQYADEKTPVAQ